MTYSKIDMSAAPLVLPPRAVLPAWLDSNNHMNVAYYVLVFDEGLGAVWDGIGLGDDYLRAEHCGGFVLEAHVCYLREVREGDKLRLHYQLLNFDDKRMHYIMLMFNEEKNYLAATSEQISIHVDLDKRKVCPFPANIYDKLAALLESHSSLPVPEQVGKSIRLKPAKPHAR